MTDHTNDNNRRSLKSRVANEVHTTLDEVTAWARQPENERAKAAWERGRDEELARRQFGAGHGLDADDISVDAHAVYDGHHEACDPPMSDAQRVILGVGTILGTTMIGITALAYSAAGSIERIESENRYLGRLSVGVDQRADPHPLPVTDQAA